MRRVLICTVALGIVAASAALASDGLADSSCPRGDAARIEWEKVWRVDANFDDVARAAIDWIPQGNSFSHADARAMVDIALQNLARQSRAFVTMRVLEGNHTCSFGSGGCVRALWNWEAPVECALVGAGGYVGLGSNDVTVCAENVSAWNMVRTLEHEIGHTYNLAHELGPRGRCLQRHRELPEQRWL